MESVQNMKKIFIIKAGNTFSDIENIFGGFDQWARDLMGNVNLEVLTLDVNKDFQLPDVKKCAGVVITGSHAMVSEKLAWSEQIAQWIPRLIEAKIPLLGICYGHQLLAHALGGKVGFHPKGKEVGTVEVTLLRDGLKDSLFKDVTESFKAHVTHAQTVLTLPTAAVRLAENSFEPNHAFRIGHSAWGVQFHPEFSDVIMRLYIEKQEGDLEKGGQDVVGLLQNVKKTPLSTSILKNFAAIIMKRTASK